MIPTVPFTQGSPWQKLELACSSNVLWAKQITQHFVLLFLILKSPLGIYPLCSSDPFQVTHTYAVMCYFFPIYA